MCFTKSRNFKEVFMVGGTNLPSSPLPHHTTSVEFADFVELYLEQITFKLGTCASFEALCLAVLAGFRQLVPVKKSVEESIRDIFQNKLEFGRISFVAKPSEGRTSNKLNPHMTSTFSVGTRLEGECFQDCTIPVPS